MTIALRVIPPVVRISRRPQRMIERSLMVYKHTWILIVSGFFEPLFYLLSTRVGLGHLVGTVTSGGRSVDYATFVAPALMASSAMNGAVYDSTMNVFHKLRYAKTYDAILATPMGVGDVTLGEIGWALIRGLVYACTFLVAMTALGTVHSAWALLAIPACVLIGFSFASCGLALVTYMRGWADFEWVPTVTMPLFLFSATFYPASSYGRWRGILQVSPLYHGVALVRAATTGAPGWSILGHVAFLLAIAFAGLWVASRRLGRLLLS